ncbi:MAG: ABC transporter substrate-binding protein [bacterium]
MRKTAGLFFMSLFLILVFSTLSFAQSLPEGVPREDTLIMDQIFRYESPQNNNIWVPGGGAQPTRQGLISDTLWYLDQLTGEWYNSLAEEEPIYNDDYTEMTVNLREGIYWSDGEEFDADDLIFTINTLLDNSGMIWASELATFIDNVEKLDDYSVKFNLKRKNPRLHYQFTVRYNAVYMMPEHIWKDVEKPMEFDFNPMVSLGPYVQEDVDSSGYWELFKKREDWDRTTVGVLKGEPTPEYILTAFFGEGQNRVMAMLQNDIDLFMNVNFDAFNALMNRSDTARSWYETFPWAYQDELDTRYINFNLTKEPFNNREVRWALALALDIVDIQTFHMGGATKLLPIPMPSTPMLMEEYHYPLKGWLEDYELDLGNGETLKPFDKTLVQDIADWAIDEGYEVPEAQKELEEMFGIGWWKNNEEAAAKLLEKSGFSRNDDGQWLLPDGSEWEISLLTCPDEVDVYSMAMGVEEQWSDFGIEINIQSLDRTPYETRQRMGDYEVAASWMGHPTEANAVADKWPFIQSLHSDNYVEPGESSINNPARIKDEKIDEIIDVLGEMEPGTEEAKELEYEFFRRYTDQMYGLFTFSFKKYITQNEIYWTNFPTNENPYGQPLYWFMGYRFILPELEKISD